MDWVQLAQRDWNIFQDKQRIKHFVRLGKIVETDYQEITGEVYEAPIP